MWRMKDKTLTGVEADKLKKNFGVYSVLLLALFAMTFFGVCDPSGRRGMMAGGGQGPAAEVNGEVITRNDFSRAYRSRYEQYQQMYGEAFDPSAMKLAASVLRELVDDRAMFQKAVELGMKASDEEVYAILQREEPFKDEKGKFSEEVFDRYLRGNGLTEATFLAQIRRDVTLQKMRKFIADSAFVSGKAAELDYRVNESKYNIQFVKIDPQQIEVKVTPDDVKAFLADEKNKPKLKEFYDSNKREFNKPAEVRARHILVQFKGSRNASPEAQKREKADAKKVAEGLLAKAQGGADFAQLARDNTDEAKGKASGGDLGWFARDAMVPAFSDAAFMAKKGEVRGLVETPFGFHIIKVEDRREGEVIAFEAAHNRLAEMILVKERRPALAKERADQVFDAVKNGKPVEPILGSYKLTWAETGEVGADAHYLQGIGTSKELEPVLAELKKVGDIYSKPLDVRGNLFVLKLKEKKDADMSKFDSTKKKHMAMTAAYSGGSSLFNMYEKQVRSDLEKRRAVRTNDAYLALDNKAKDGAADSGSSTEN